MTAIPTITDTLVTGEELFTMGNLGPCELIDGRIVPMSPAGGEHGFVESNLSFELRLWNRQHARGWVLNGEVGIYTQRDPDRVRGADVAFFTREALPDGPPSAFIEAAPALVVEIMSPGDRWSEVRDKVREYFAIGAEQVWVVEPSTRSVHVFASPLSMQRYDEAATITGSGALEGFTLAVADLFG